MSCSVLCILGVFMIWMGVFSWARSIWAYFAFMNSWNSLLYSSSAGKSFSLISSGGCVARSWLCWRSSYSGLIPRLALSFNCLMKKDRLAWSSSGELGLTSGDYLARICESMSFLTELSELSTKRPLMGVSGLLFLRSREEMDPFSAVWYSRAKEDLGSRGPVASFGIATEDAWGVLWLGESRYATSVALTRCGGFMFSLTFNSTILWRLLMSVSYCCPVTTDWKLPGPIVF